jgi:hypothetical protein
MSKNAKTITGGIDEETRDQLRGDDFLGVGFDGMEIGNLKLRPFSTGVLRRCKTCGLDMFFKGENEIENMEAEEVLRQVAVFAWMQTQDLRLVVRSIRDGSWEEEAEIFEMQLEPKVLIELVKQCRQMAQRSEAIQFEQVLRDEEHDPERDIPGN